MEELLQLLEHLILSGPARNPAELEQLLGLLEAFRQHIKPPAQAPAGQPPSAQGPTEYPGGSS